MKKNYYLYILTFIFFLLCFDVDYRLSPPSQSSTTDDASYYYHADTLASDLDFDYSNQIVITEVAKNNKTRENSNEDIEIEVYLLNVMSLN